MYTTFSKNTTCLKVYTFATGRLYNNDNDILGVIYKRSSENHFSQNPKYDTIFRYELL